MGNPGHREIIEEEANKLGDSLAVWPKAVRAYIISLSHQRHPPDGPKAVYDDAIPEDDDNEPVCDSDADDADSEANSNEKRQEGN